MSYTPIENQPVTFGYTPIDCKALRRSKSQLVDNFDVTKFQLNVEPCDNSPELVDQPDFAGSGQWVLGAGWTINNGQACKAEGSLGTLFQDDVFVVGNYYQVIIEVVEISGRILVFAGNTQLFEISEAGTYNVFATATNNGTLAIQPQSIDDTLCLSSISAKKVFQNLLVSAWNADGTFIKSIAQADFPDLFVFVKNTVTVTVDWTDEGLVDGCYYLCLSDPCINNNGQNGVYNGDFEFDNVDPVESGWLETGQTGLGSITIANNQATFTSNSPLANVNFDNQITSVTSGLSYFVQYTIATLTAGCTAQVSLGGVLGTPRNAPGSYFEFIVAGGPIIQLRNTNAPAGTGTIVWDGFRIQLRNGSDITCNSQSQNFAVGSYPCTTFLEMYCLQDSLGFAFIDTEFTLTYRSDARLVNSDNPYSDFTNTLHKNTLGTNRNQYYISRKNRTLAFYGEPEYTHDFLRMIHGADVLLIDDIQHTVPQDAFPAIRWDTERQVGTLEIEVEKTTQLLEKFRVNGDIGDTAGGGDEEVVFVEPASGDEFAEPNTGFTLLIPG